MEQLHFICGPQGAGKSTRARKLATELDAVVFAIDDWMIQLYGPDLPQPPDFGWIMARVRRCEDLIWQLAQAVVHAGGRAVLDIGFMTAADRLRFRHLADTAGLSWRLHPVTAPVDIRRQRVAQRNVDRGDTFALVVTPQMFDAMEGRYQAPETSEFSAG